MRTWERVGGIVMQRIHASDSMQLQTWCIERDPALANSPASAASNIVNTLSIHCMVERIVQALSAQRHPEDFTSKKPTSSITTHMSHPGTFFERNGGLTCFNFNVMFIRAVDVIDVN